ncbi:MAG: dTMP kinase [Micrococcales bacterium]|nr:dTMP kinase [Micrococcales bacterium]
MSRGRFIAFEGGDGVGKSVQVELLAGQLRATGVAGVDGGVELVLTREPGGTKLGAELRQTLLHGGEVAPATEALLYAADRAQHVAQVIIPALERGAVVISDRFVDSSLAYQSYGRGLDLEAVMAINHFGTGGLVPDMTVVLEVPPAVAAQRQAAAGDTPDRLESAGAAFHQAVAAGYLDLARLAPERHTVIPAMGTPAQVAARVWAALAPVLDVKP